MELVRLRLVTIIAEAVLERRLLPALAELGARGYTVAEVDGEGSRGVRAGDWEGPNLRIETVVSDPVAEAILAHLADHYFENYAVIAFVSDVEVVRGNKYV